jgi:hypothetical protein
MMLGAKPRCVKVTVNGPSTESSIEHGVRQREPSDVVASAPCGSEFKWMVALTDLGGGRPESHRLICAQARSQARRVI